LIGKAKGVDLSTHVPSLASARFKFFFLFFFFLQKGDTDPCTSYHGTNEFSLA